MLDVPTLYWDPAGPHYIYGRAVVGLEDPPTLRHEGLEHVVMLVPAAQFVAMRIPWGSAGDTTWQGVTRGKATFLGGRDSLPAAWFRGPGLYRLQAAGKTLLIFLIPHPGKWQLLLVRDEKTARAILSGDVPVQGQVFVEVPSVLDLVP